MLFLWQYVALLYFTTLTLFTVQPVIAVNLIKSSKIDTKPEPLFTKN